MVWCLIKWSLTHITAAVSLSSSHLWFVVCHVWQCFAAPLRAIARPPLSVFLTSHMVFPFHLQSKDPLMAPSLLCGLLLRVESRRVWSFIPHLTAGPLDEGSVIPQVTDRWVLQRTAGQRSSAHVIWMTGVLCIGLSIHWWNQDFIRFFIFSEEYCQNATLGTFV